MSVWDDVVGQAQAVTELQAAAADARLLVRERVSAAGDQAADGPKARSSVPTGGAPGSVMTHAWLITGPPGSGRSTAARAFAAALLCRDGVGCGECPECVSTRRGTHPDLIVINTQVLSIKVDFVRELVRSASLAPSLGRWQTIVIEDADRLVARAWDALLKDLEEPASRTVWLLCAPTVEEVLPTILSRCRHVGLRIPPTSAVAALLTRRDGIDPALAAFAARASQGHIGRARHLALDENARIRRAEVLRIPSQVGDVGSAMVCAANLVDAATEDAKARAEQLDPVERETLFASLGIGPGGRRPKGSEGTIKELEKAQKQRFTRTVRDSIDHALVDLAAYYRDVLAVQVGAEVGLTHEEARPGIEKLARRSTPEATLRRVEAILAARRAIEANVAPLLAAEALTLALHAG